MNNWSTALWAGLLFVACAAGANAQTGYCEAPSHPDCNTKGLNCTAGCGAIWGPDASQHGKSTCTRLCYKTASKIQQTVTPPPPTPTQNYVRRVSVPTNNPVTIKNTVSTPPNPNQPKLIPQNIPGNTQSSGQQQGQTTQGQQPGNSTNTNRTFGEDSLTTILKNHDPRRQ